MADGALGGRQVGGRPLGDLELGVPRLVAVLDPVAVLEADGALAVDEHRAERLVAVGQRLPGELDAAAEVDQVGLGRHRFLESS